MKKYLNIIKGIFFVSLLSLIVSSCQEDEWDDHYDKNANRGEYSTQLLKELGRNYKGMADALQQIGLDQILHSGLEYTILAVPDETLTRIKAENTAKGFERIIKNSVFLTKSNYVTDTARNSFVNERIAFYADTDDGNYIINLHSDTIYPVEGKINQDIYGAMVHEVDDFFSLNEDVLEYIGALDSLYSRWTDKFYWDTLYYADETVQQYPTYDEEKGIVTLAALRTLMFIDERAAAEAEEDEEGAGLIRGEHLEFLMVKNVRNKLNKFYEDYPDNEMNKYFAGYDVRTDIEQQISADSVVYFIAKTTHEDSLRFQYYKSTGKKDANGVLLDPDLFYTIHKDEVELKKLSNGNNINYIDTLLITEKIRNLWSDYIIRSFIEVADDISSTRLGARYARYPDGSDPENPAVFPSTGFALVGVGRQPKELVVDMVSATYSSAKKGDYFEILYPASILNTAPYQMKLIFPAGTGERNTLSYVVSVVNGDTKIPLMPLGADGLPMITEEEAANDPIEDGLAKYEFDFKDFPVDRLTAVTEDHQGNALTNTATKAYYEIGFAPFQLKDYTKPVSIRFELRSRMPSSRSRVFVMRSIAFNMEGNE